MEVPYSIIQSSHTYERLFCVPSTILGPGNLMTNMQVPILKKLPTFWLGTCATYNGSTRSGSARVKWSLQEEAAVI